MFLDASCVAVEVLKLAEPFIGNPACENVAKAKMDKTYFSTPTSLLVRLVLPPCARVVLDRRFPNPSSDVP